MLYLAILRLKIILKRNVHIFFRFLSEYLIFNYSQTHKNIFIPFKLENIVNHNAFADWLSWIEFEMDTDMLVWRNMERYNCKVVFWRWFCFSFFSNHGSWIFSVDISRYNWALRFFNLLFVFVIRICIIFSLPFFEISSFINLFTINLVKVT